jgi:hypothetical protein
MSLCKLRELCRVVSGQDQYYVHYYVVIFPVSLLCHDHLYRVCALVFAIRDKEVLPHRVTLRRHGAQCFALPVAR